MLAAIAMRFHQQYTGDGTIGDQVLTPVKNGAILAGVGRGQ
jgi:hypothetical protein